MQKIILMNVEINTQDPKFYTQYNLERKLSLLTETVHEANKKVNENCQNTINQNIRAIVVAPEYFFANSTEANLKNKYEKRQLSENEAIYIQEKLAVLSKRYPKILIIPGTTAWYEHAIAPLKEQPAHYNGYATVPTATSSSGNPHNDMIKIKNKYAKRGIFLTNDQAAEKYKESPDSLWLEVVEQVEKNPQPFIGRIQGGNVPKNTRADKIKLLTQGQSSIKDLEYMYFIQSNSDLLILRNTAYFYLNGQQVYAYHKRSDFQEKLSHDKKSVYVPGEQAPIVKIGGIVFGIEICLDHNCGVLKKFIEYHKQLAKKSAYLSIFTSSSEYQENVDVHLVLSASVKNVPDNFCFKKDGCIIHSSSNPDNAKFFNGGKINYIAFKYYPLLSTTVHSAVENKTEGVADNSKKKSAKPAVPTGSSANKLREKTDFKATASKKNSSYDQKISNNKMTEKNNDTEEEEMMGLMIAQYKNIKRRG